MAAGTGSSACRSNGQARLLPDQRHRAAPDAPRPARGTAAPGCGSRRPSGSAARRGWETAQVENVLLDAAKSSCQGMTPAPRAAAAKPPPSAAGPLMVR